MSLQPRAPIGKNRFADRPLGTIFFLELCAGTAILTSVAIQSGMQGIGIDSLRNRHQKVGPVAVFDLTVAAHTQILKNMVIQGEVDAIHSGAPCGTASRARDIALSPSQHGPPPLRSDEFPEGLPSLEGQNLAKVQSANLVYAATSELMELGDEHGCLCSAENPLRGYK